jgi:hypothetical protein
VTPDRSVRIGFTGTRTGMSVDQYETVRSLLMLAASDADVELHHGDCVGADEDVHELCLTLGVPVVIHPPRDGRLRAFCHGAIRMEPRKPYSDAQPCDRGRHGLLDRDATRDARAAPRARSGDMVNGPVRAGSWPDGVRGLAVAVTFWSRRSSLGMRERRWCGGCSGCSRTTSRAAGDGG